MDEFECIDRFESQLIEFNLINNYIKKNKQNIDKYQMFIKLSIIMLSIKFECFIEDFFEEFYLKVSCSYSNKTLPNKYKEMYVDSLCEYCKSLGSKKQVNKMIPEVIKLFGNVDSSINDISVIKPKFKFNYGKHGSEEVRKIFQKGRLLPFIEENPIIKSYLGNIDSLIAVRNNIIHQDASPGISYLDLIKYKNSISGFVEELGKYMKLQ